MHAIRTAYSLTRYFVTRANKKEVSLIGTTKWKWGQIRFCWERLPQGNSTQLRYTLHLSHPEI